MAVEAEAVEVLVAPAEETGKRKVKNQKIAKEAIFCLP